MYLHKAVNSTMLPTTITIIAGVFGLYWSLKARNRFTKARSLLLAGTSLLPLVPQQTFQSYAPYAIAFACVMAGFEPANSIRIKLYHKLFFGIFGVLFAVVAMDSVVTWPFDLTLWPVIALFLLLVGGLVSQDLKMMRTRLAVPAVWAGMGVNCILSSL